MTLPPDSRPLDSNAEGAQSLFHGLGKRIAFGALTIPFTLPLIAYGIALSRRPVLQTQAAQPLFQGITYERIVLNQPRPQLIHRLSLDLTAPGLKPWVTPPISVTDPQLAASLEGDRDRRRETIAQKATTVLERQNLQVVINANFFFPFVENSPWQTTPAPGEPVSLVGSAISQGQLVSLSETSFPALCFLASQGASAQASVVEASVVEPSVVEPRTTPTLVVEPRATSAINTAEDIAPARLASPQAVIAAQGQCPAETQEAVAGNLLLIDQGQPGDLQGEVLTKPYPMVIAALDATGQQLQLILVDGKQPFYSEGMTVLEAIALLQSWGIHYAIRLDGGGSTTLAVEGPDGLAQLRNAVIQAKVPGRERPVANHLGFYAQPLP